MKWKGFIYALLAGSLVAWGVDFLMYEVIFKDSMADMNKTFASVMYAEGQGPSHAWFIVYEVCRMAIVALIILQRPMMGFAAFIWGLLAAGLTIVIMDFWWVMMFPAMNFSYMFMDVASGAVLGGVFGWLMAFVYSKVK
jgi:hypothetical protein